MVAHSALAGANLHENKGVSAATNNTVATAASGATVWQKVTTSMIDTTSVFSVNKRYLTGVIADVSAPSFIIIPLPACTLNTLYYTLGGTITTANSIITVTNSTGPATVGTQTITAAGSVEGTTFTQTASANNTFTAGSYVKIATDGGSTVTFPLFITIAFTLTA